MTQEIRDELRLQEITGTNAGGAKFDRLDSTVVVNFDRLKIDFKGTLGVLDNVHTDTAALLGETLAGDVAAIGFGLAAHRTDFAHFFLTICKLYFTTYHTERRTTCFKKSGGSTGTRTRDTRLKRAMLYRLSYRPAVRVVCV